MPNSLAVDLPAEPAYVRRMLFAAEILDAVTLEPVTKGVVLTATGLTRRPIVNYGGHYVWLDEGGAMPQQVIVDTSGTSYESVTVAAPTLPARMVRIELAPRYDYPFPPGVTALRGSLIESLVGSPVPVAGAEIWLQWIDDTAPGSTWVDSPTHSHSRANGDFAVHLRLTPKQIPRTAPGGIRSRLRVGREGTTRTSSEFSLPEGRLADALPPFVWSEMVP